MQDGMKGLFFELIRLSIGTYDNLSRQPSIDEWSKLYSMARKQSLIGVCFAGVKKFLDSSPQNNIVAVIPSKIYFRWLGTVAHIQERNKWMDKRCAEFEQKLAEDGYKSCVLKGQGLAALYENLRGLRQPGDIDAWAIGEPKSVIEWARKTGTMTFYDYHHADLSLYKDTEIELHYRPTLSRNLLRNARLQRWLKSEGEKHIVFKEELGFSVPDYVFNVVLTLNHNFWHLMYEGVGLRQVLDLFFVLRSVKGSTECQSQLQSEALMLIKHFRLQRFAAASMWIMKEVFGLEEQYLIGNPNEKAGRFLLDEIMQSGNFGKYDKRLNRKRYQSRIGLMFSWLKHNSRLVRYYPVDVLWTPIGILRISLWRRWHYRKENVYK